MPEARRKEKTIVSKREPKVVTPTRPEPDEKTLQRMGEQELVRQGRTLFQSASDGRRRYDWEWLTRDLYRRGYQFSRYDASNRTVVLSSRSQVKIPINLVQAQMRIIRNQVVAFKPKWEVLPKSIDEQSLNNARYSGRLLDYFYDSNNLKNLIKRTVTQGLTYSVGGPWQIGFDPDANDGKGDVFIWLIDTYDFYIDPYARTLEEAEYCFKAVRRPLAEIKSNPNYTFRDDLQHGEYKIAASEYKQFLLQALTQHSQANQTQDDGAIVYEWYQKVRVTESNVDEIKKQLKENDQDAEELRQGETVIRAVTFLDLLSDPLRVQTFRRSDFPFVMYLADVEPTSLYGESWIKHIIPMNRVVNMLESSILEYHNIFAKGRLAIQKNSGTRIVANQHGQIVEYNAGALPPTAIPIAPLPNSYQIQIDNMRRYIEDIGGAHDVSMGRIPTGVKSGVGIAELKSADSTNQQDLVDNLQEFLIDVAHKVLYEVSQNYDVPRLIEALGKGGQPEHFAVIGEDYSKNRKNKNEVKIGPDVFDLAVIGKKNQIRVTVGSWLAYTKSAQHDKLKELYEAQLIDQKTFLEHAEFNDVDGIVERTRQEELLGKLRGTPAQEGMPTDEEIAQQENIMMTKEGKMPDVAPEDNHQVHLIVHQEAIGYEGNPIVEAHMAQHEQMIQDGREGQVNRLAGLPPQQEQLPPEQPEAPQSMPAMPMGLPSPGAAGIGAALPPGGSPEEAALMQTIQGLMG